MVGFNKVGYTVWVPDIIIDESVTKELETGEIYPEITEKEKQELVKNKYLYSEGFQAPARYRAYRQRGRLSIQGYRHQTPQR